jgi:hypothetical protein
MYNFLEILRKKIKKKLTSEKIQNGGENVFFQFKISEMAILQKLVLLYFLLKTQLLCRFLILKIQNGG